MMSVLRLSLITLLRISVIALFILFPIHTTSAFSTEQWIQGKWKIRWFLFSIANRMVLSKRSGLVLGACQFSLLAKLTSTLALLALSCTVYTLLTLV